MENDFGYEDEMDENCVAGCTPGEHKCDRSKVVKIIIKDVGRLNANEEYSFPLNHRTEQQFAEIALEKCKLFLRSDIVNLVPYEKKGEGFWLVTVGEIMRPVGEVQIII